MTAGSLQTIQREPKCYEPYRPSSSALDAASAYAKKASESSRPALSAKCANLKISEKKAATSRVSKNKISHPMSQIVEPESHAPEETSGIDDGFHPAFYPPEAEKYVHWAPELQRNIGKASKRYPSIKVAPSPKASPLQRSKTALVRATRALADRFGSNRQESATYHPAKDEPTDSEFETVAGPEYSAGSQQGRIRRHISEGKNLGNPKIKTLLGDGNVPRKPLLVHETRARYYQLSDMPDDPFSDDQADSEESDSQASSRGSGNGNEEETNLYRKAREDQYALFSPPPVQKQIPSADMLSSSPLGSSTRLILYNRNPIGQKNRYRDDLAQNLPSAGLKLGEPLGSEGSTSPAPKLPENHSLWSVKRKPAREDLRSELDADPKKPKLSSSLSSDDGLVTTALRDLDTRERRARWKKCKKALSPDSSPTTTKGRGLKIFETAKGKAPVTSVVDMVKKPHGRPRGNTKSSVTRPTNTLISHDSKGHVPLLDPNREDSMDTDGLQTDDKRY